MFSGNWLSLLILPALVYSVKEGKGMWEGGWPAIKAHLTRDTLFLVGCYALLFLWALAKSGYQDHKDLVARSQNLSRDAASDRSKSASQLQETKDWYGSTLTDLRVQCGIKEGMNIALTNQNRDQQNSINNCQNQALKLLTPEELDVLPFLWSDNVTNGVDHNTTFLVLANRSVTPVRMRVGCNRPIKWGNAKIVGSGTMTGGTRVGKNFLDVAIDSPTWGPRSPMRVDIQYVGSEVIDCTFSAK